MSVKTATAAQIAKWSAANANMAHFFNITIPAMSDEELTQSLGAYFPGLIGNKNTRTRRNHAAMVTEATSRGWSAENIETASTRLAN